MSNQTKRLYEFGPFRLNTAERTLARDGHCLPLTPKAFDTLRLLVEHSGHLLEKDELIQALWPETFVEEANLTNNISLLRKALGASEGETSYIETVPRRGYRFVASVRELRDEEADLVVEQHTLSSVVIEEQGGEADGGEASRVIEAGRQMRLPPAARARRRWWGKPKVLAAMALLAVGATVAAYFLMPRKSKPPATVSTIKSIAVLPFKPLSADRRDDYLGLGMADTLIMKLSNLQQLIVRPTSAVRKYTAQEQDPIAAGRELRVESVLEGSIQKVGGRVRLTVQLVSVADGRHLWTDKFDEQFTDILTVEDRVSERVAAALSLKLTGEQKSRLTKQHTENSEAYQFYMKGRYFWNKRTDEGVEKSKDYFEQAIAKDPNCALAYGGLADYYILRADAEGKEGAKEARQKAKAAVTSALEIDDTLAEVHASLALIKWRYDRDSRGAEIEFKRVFELNPSYALGHYRYSVYLSGMARLDEAIREIEQALELDPTSVATNGIAARTFYFARQYDRAIEHCRAAIELDPNDFSGYSLLGRIYDAKGMYEEAITNFRKSIELAKGSVIGLSFFSRVGLGHAYAKAGNRVEATKILIEMKELYDKGDSPIGSSSIAFLYEGLGDKDRAFEWLEKSQGKMGDAPPLFKINPQWDGLRDDPRFADLLRRMGLAQ